ncbi:single-stranded DNA-binding protein [Erysipelothrix rhusiopathiae]|uniref:Single-stranded DNA-binding protein n=2 Tax=Erysipelothrix TaxID=1647 RepID=E7FWX8_ERYRH|nr:single-stranded DNA-binding protein [Erysipelothrix rhusiopathiae]CAH2760539.1 single-stranded DNA-binding protein [Erysipelothrix sp. A18Y020d]AGN24883.1 single-strand DNA-binding protein [Erysipelothrix rhusiopathiae SY1027]AMS10382.1 single-stranded DNA-binding protein [Erysipelothrix rhusiopathiae]AOO67277.1 single-stranded DNA-binding protein [Erysipelothrix rhusiopathiae]AWU42255.1 single-stranded DNA-binding protein [Erysipelothrix rhusiopathiae]
MINRTILVGRLTRDPELRKTQTGKSVVSFTVACNRRFGQQDETDFINCVAWNQTADFMANYLLKGALVGLEGRIQSRSYEDATGKRVYVQEVVVDTLQSLESRAQRQEQGASQGQYQNQNSNQGGSSYTPSYQADPEPSFSMDDEPVLDITSDDLPF